MVVTNVPTSLALSIFRQKPCFTKCSSTSPLASCNSGYVHQFCPFDTTTSWWQMTFLQMPNPMANPPAQKNQILDLGPHLVIPKIEHLKIFLLERKRRGGLSVTEPKVPTYLSRILFSGRLVVSTSKIRNLGRCLPGGSNPGGRTVGWRTLKKCSWWDSNLCQRWHCA